MRLCNKSLLPPPPSSALALLHPRHFECQHGPCMRRPEGPRVDSRIFASITTPLGPRGEEEELCLRSKIPSVCKVTLPDWAWPTPFCPRVLRFMLPPYASHRPPPLLKTWDEPSKWVEVSRPSGFHQLRKLIPCLPPPPPALVRCPWLCSRLAREPLPPSATATARPPSSTTRQPQHDRQQPRSTRCVVVWVRGGGRAGGCGRAQGKGTREWTRTQVGRVSREREHKPKDDTREDKARRN